MIRLSTERIEQMLHNETPKTEELPTILRGVYTRYMYLYEQYFSDIEALNDGKIAEFKKYHEETKSLIQYYYMDIPQDICVYLEDFDEKYTDKLLGPNWQSDLFDSYDEFKAEKKGWGKSEKTVKAEFKEAVKEAFFDAMESVFRTGFGTGSKTLESTVSGIAGLLFGGKD